MWNNTVKTNKGLALDRKLQEGTLTLKLTKAVAGSGRVLTTQLINQTQVSDLKQTLSLGAISKSDGQHAVTLPISLRNTGLKTKYNLQQIGIYAQDPDESEGEILYVLAQIEEDSMQEIPPESKSPGFGIQWNFGLNVSNTENVQVVIDPAGLLTTDQGDSRYANNAEFNIHVADRGNPHEVTKSQVGLGNADNTSDVNKPISAAMQAALNKKLDKPGDYTVETGMNNGWKYEKKNSGRYTAYKIETYTNIAVNTGTNLFRSTAQKGPNLPINALTIDSCVPELIFNAKSGGWVGKPGEAELTTSWQLFGYTSYTTTTIQVKFTVMGTWK